MVVLLLVGLGLTPFSLKLFENDSVDTACGRDQAGVSEPIRFSAQLQRWLLCRQGRASLAEGFVTQAQSCWEGSGVARPAALADGEDLPSQQKLQGSLRRRGGWTPAPPVTHGSVQAKG